MTESVIDPGSFQKIIGAIMKQKYNHEQRLADNDLSRHRQRSERSRSKSRTPDRRRSISAASLGSRAAQQTINSNNQPIGLPPFIPSRGRTPTNAAEISPRGESERSRVFSDLLGRNSILNYEKNGNKDTMEPTFGSACSKVSIDNNELNEEYNTDKFEEYSGTGRKSDKTHSLIPNSARCNTIQSSTPDNNRGYTLISNIELDNKEFQPNLTQVECSRCIALEEKVQDLQEALNQVREEVMIISAKQKSSKNLSVNDEIISELPDNPEELGNTTEEKFLTVVTAIAKRVQRLESDLESSLEQVRIMEAVAIERDKKLNKTKIGHEEIKEIVTKLLCNSRIDFPNELTNLYRLWGLDPRTVREAIDSSNPTVCLDMLLTTPPFARVLRIMMESNSDILNAFREQQLRNNAEEASYYHQISPPNRRSGSQSSVNKKSIPLHESLLGIYLQDEKELQGVRVISVLSGSPAANILSSGDVIVHVNHITVRSVADISYVLSRANPSSPIYLSFQVSDEAYLETVQVKPFSIL